MILPEGPVSKSYDDIAACAAAYASARLDSDYSTGITPYEAVLEARVRLADCLIEAGWTASPEVARLLDLDRSLLEQARGSIEPPVS